MKKITTVWLDEKVHKKLKQLKKELRFDSLNEVLVYLLERS